MNLPLPPNQPPMNGSHPEEPLHLAPDQDDDLFLSPQHRPATDRDAARPAASPESAETRVDHRFVGEALRWALQSLHHPSMAAADWLVRDIDPTATSAAEFITDPTVSVRNLRAAKVAFKTMRLLGEKSADRRLGARMYAATIAAAMVRHGKRISTQSERALRRAFVALLDDRSLPQSLRDLAGMGICALDNQSQQNPPPGRGEA